MTEKLTEKLEKLMEMAQGSPLGRSSTFTDRYDPSLLFAIDRSQAREQLGISGQLPFHGVDIWNAHELSWLSAHGKPEVATAEIRVPCNSPSLVESKSLKLYLNGFANSRFNNGDEVQRRVVNDLSSLLQAEVLVRLDSLDKSLDERFDVRPAGYCIDDMDVEIDCYQVTRDFLKTGGERISERLYSNLLRSRCPVTGQPDWATVSVTYTGRAIDRQGLLRYLVSYRNHQGFHEQLIEQIFCDIQHVCQPESLTVYGRFTRRGGIDINPWRSSEEGWAPNWLEARQ